MVERNMRWDIRPAGRAWRDDELRERIAERLPAAARIEIHRGQLLFSEEERLILLGLLLENLGLRTGLGFLADALEGMDTDAALQAAVAELRRALAPSAERP